MSSFYHVVDCVKCLDCVSDNLFFDDGYTSPVQNLLFDTKYFVLYITVWRVSHDIIASTDTDVFKPPRSLSGSLIYETKMTWIISQTQSP